MLAKGRKLTHGYATLPEEVNGMDYRDISSAMTKIGHKMNHSTARNILIRALRKIVSSVAADAGLTLSPAEIDEIARSPEFQFSLAEVVSDMHYASWKVE